MGDPYDNASRERVTDAMNAVVRSVFQDHQAGIRAEDLCHWHQVSCDPDTLPDGESSGRYRSVEVSTGGRLFPPPERCAALIETLIGNADRASRIEPAWPHEKLARAVLRGMYLHLGVILVHPFADGNGRVARLAEAFTLLSGGVPMPAVHLMSNHVNAHRKRYYNILEAINKGGKLGPFFDFMITGFDQQLGVLLDEVAAEQLQRAWLDAAYNWIETSLGGADRELAWAIALRCYDGVWPEAEAVHIVLSGRNTEGKDSSGPPDVSRVLGAMHAAGLIREEDGGWSADPSLATRMLPPRRQSE